MPLTYARSLEDWWTQIIMMTPKSSSLTSLPQPNFILIPLSANITWIHSSFTSTPISLRPSFSSSKWLAPPYPSLSTPPPLPIRFKVIIPTMRYTWTFEPSPANWAKHTINNSARRALLPIRPTQSTSIPCNALQWIQRRWRMWLQLQLNSMPSIGGLASTIRKSSIALICLLIVMEGGSQGIHLVIRAIWEPYVNHATFMLPEANILIPLRQNIVVVLVRIP